ncbi:MAG: glutamate 5-kinase [Alphaproteobacteria bacterium]|nr:glutamate 5-kinase [Alphaproteobacteria bacterium]
MERTTLNEARRVVVKLGTRVLTEDDGRLALSRLFEVVEETARAWRAGREILLVSSGAVGLGRDALGLFQSPRDLAARQACAAVGQTRLMSLYEVGFSRLGMRCAQVLLTQGDFDERARYLNLRSALNALLAHKVVPVINENDVVSTEELALTPGRGRLVFGDNDRLSALVASKLDADLLVLLTDVDAVYDRNPRDHADARRLDRLEPEDAVDAGGAGSAASRGGMRSKVDAARVAARSGCHAVIASGRTPGVLRRVLAGEVEGTWVPAVGGLAARRRWIAFAAAPRGVLHLDPGAVRALRERGASLLAAGVSRVEGDFAEGDVVELKDDRGAVIGRGVVSCDAEGARRWRSGEAPPNTHNRHALVHRDTLVLEP